MVGSHLGVLGALEAVRSLRRSGFAPRRPIWVAGFIRKRFAGRYEPLLISGCAD